MPTVQGESEIETRLCNVGSCVSTFLVSSPQCAHRRKHSNKTHADLSIVRGSTLPSLVLFHRDFASAADSGWATTLKVGATTYAREWSCDAAAMYR